VNVPFCFLCCAGETDTFPYEISADQLKTWETQKLIRSKLTFKSVHSGLTQAILSAFAKKPDSEGSDDKILVAEYAGECSPLGLQAVKHGFKYETFMKFSCMHKVVEAQLLEGECFVFVCT
jgi:hypothetical protein